VETLSNIIAFIFSFKAYVMLPAVILVVGIAIRMNVGRAALSALRLGVGFAGIFIAYYLYLRHPQIPADFVRAFPGVFRTVNNKYYVDELYQAVFVRGLFALGRIAKGFIDETLIDGTVNGIARLIGGIGSLITLIQPGYVQGYAFAMIIGAIAVLGYLIMKVIL